MSHYEADLHHSEQQHRSTGELFLVGDDGGRMLVTTAEFFGGEGLRARRLRMIERFQREAFEPEVETETVLIERPRAGIERRLDELLLRVARLEAS